MPWRWWPSTLQRRDRAVPRISSMVPESSLAKDSCCFCGTVFTISSKVVFPLSLIFFGYFLCLSGSLRALMVRQRQKAPPWCGPVCCERSPPLWSSDLPTTACLGDVITNLFRSQLQGGWSWGLLRGAPLRSWCMAALAPWSHWGRT